MAAARLTDKAISQRAKVALSAFVRTEAGVRSAARGFVSG